MARKAEDPMLVKLTPGIENLWRAIEGQKYTKQPEVATIAEDSAYQGKDNCGEISGCVYTSRDICKTLQCSRAFFNRHIVPYTPHVYVNKYSSDFFHFHKDYSDQAHGYHFQAPEVTATVTLRSWMVDVGILTGIDCDAWQKKVDAWFLEKESKGSAGLVWSDYIDELLKQPEFEHAYHFGKKATYDKKLKREVMPRFGRGDASWLDLGIEPVRFDQFELLGLKTPAAMTDYGDVAEQTHMRIYRECMPRVEIELADKTTWVMYASVWSEQHFKDMGIGERYNCRYFPLPIEFLPKSYIEKQILPALTNKDMGLLQLL